MPVPTQPNPTNTEGDVMVTQQEKEMLWECFGKGSGVEVAMSQQEGFRNYLLDETREFGSCGAVANVPENTASRVSVRPTLTKVTGAK